MDKQNQTRSSWQPFCLLVERQLLGLASSDEKNISNKKKYFHWLPKDHLEVIFIEEDKAQQGPAHAPLIPDNRFDRIQIWKKYEHQPAVLKHDNIQHSLKHLLENFGPHLRI